MNTMTMETTRRLTPTAARNDMFNLIDEVAESHEPVIVAGPRNSIVMIGTEDWKSICETMYLLSIPNMKETILKGIDEEVDDMVDMEALDWTDTK